MRPIRLIFLLAVLLSTLTSCRKEEEIIPSTRVQVTEGRVGLQTRGFFLLNEGNMGSNKATLDYLDYGSGLYMRNIYAERNPNVTKELGDVGNDLQIYRDRIYAVINMSNLVEVMDLRTAKHIQAISIPNCRYIVFRGDYAYVSSYAGTLNESGRIGYVAKIDLRELKVIATCDVGRQPEEMAILGNKLYVANSGGYEPANYDNTISVIDLDTFTEVKKVKIAINLHRIQVDPKGRLWISSRGNYGSIPSRLYVFDPQTEQILKVLETPVSNMKLYRDKLYVYSNSFSKKSGTSTTSYPLISTSTMEVISPSFITDGTEGAIKAPYGLAINPEVGEIYLTDAKSYVVPGTLHAYGLDGRRRWSVTTGDIPAHFAFTTIALRTKD
jgi:hypothetical protein